MEAGTTIRTANILLENSPLIETTPFKAAEDTALASRTQGVLASIRRAIAKASAQKQSLRAAVAAKHVVDASIEAINAQIDTKTGNLLAADNTNSSVRGLGATPAKEEVLQVDAKEFNTSEQPAAAANAQTRDDEDETSDSFVYAPAKSGSTTFRQFSIMCIHK